MIDLRWNNFAPGQKRLEYRYLNFKKWTPWIIVRSFDTTGEFVSELIVDPNGLERAKKALEEGESLEC